ncbi:MAG: ABC transporter substrate-binding protein [Gloeomargaritaceae cyanobacterium C42_A2020_066]|nr:ABC transporter substrate-binding protein [Gloeomargaritaceae cyanobacterium C42_A2020_066]
MIGQHLPPWLRPAGLLLALINLAACSPVPGGLRIGTLLALTGDLSQFGPPMQDAAQLLVDRVNGCGGVLGQPVTLISEDDQTDPAAGVAAMTKLAEVDRVAGVVGATSSAVTNAALDIAVRNQVVMISPSSTSPVFTERAKKGELQGFWFRTAPPDTFQSQALAQVAQTQRWKTVGILAINNDYGRGLVNAFVPALIALGGQVPSTPVFYDPGATSFDAEIKNALRGRPEALLLVSYPETGSLILRAAYQQGGLDRTQLLLTDGLKDARIAELVGKTPQGRPIVAGAIGTAAAAGGPGEADFRKRYQEAFQREPNVYAPNTWDATALLVLAAEAAQSTQGAALKEGMRTVANPPGEPVTDVCQALELIRAGREIDFQGASSDLDFDPQGDVATQYQVWSITSDGQVVPKSVVTVGNP